MGDWLVSVSAHTRFVDRSSRRVDGEFAAVRSAILSRRVSGFRCDVRGAASDIADRDQMWVLWPAGDVGVMAVGRATGRDTRPAPGRVRVALHQRRSRGLVLDPLPSALLRRWVPEQRSGALRLDERPRVLELVQSWETERVGRDVALLEPLGVIPWRVSPRAPAALSNPVASVVPFLRTQDFAVGLGQRDLTSYLLARRGRDVLVVHGVSAEHSRDREAAIAAFGLVSEHRWALVRDRAELRMDVRAWLAFAIRPRGGLVSFLEDEGLLVTWRQASGRVEMSERSRSRWYQELGVR